jgi:hypothetical protein
VQCNAQTGAKCLSRAAAMRYGEMYYSKSHRGWIYPADGRAVPRVLRAKLQAPYTWTHCPFCDQPLPEVAPPPEPPEPWKDTYGEGPE